MLGHLYNLPCAIHQAYPCHMFKRTGIAVLAAVSLALPLSAPADAADPDIPRNFVRHELTHWTWYGPQDWVASDGANDLLVGSPTGERFLHYGASAAPCVYPGYWSTSDEFFAYFRNASLAGAAENFGLYSFPLKGAKYTNVGGIQTIGENYLRQRSTFTGKRGKKVIRGELIVDFFYAGAGSCGERLQIRSAPAKGYGPSIKVLRKVQTFIFGPR